MNRRQFLRGVAGSALATSAAGLIYGCAEAGWIDITRHTIRVPHLPPPFVGKTIALLTDPHHGPFNSLSFLQSIVEQANALKPDLIALGGDFVQGPRREYIAPACKRWANCVRRWESTPCREITITTAATSSPSAAPWTPTASPT